MLQIKLVYLEEELGNAWINDFADCPNVTILNGNILETECDAIVSPANSFGFMDGGLDLHISEKFGWHLQDELQAKIASLDEKELLIGKSITLATGNEKNSIPNFCPNYASSYEFQYSNICKRLFSDESYINSL